MEKSAIISRKKGDGFMNLELLQHAQSYIEKMANGIHPITGKSMPSEDTINNIRVSRCLFYVNNVLKDIITNGTVPKSKKKQIPFSLTPNELEHYECTSSLSISRMVQKLNALRPTEEMEKLKISQMCQWLIEIGLLQETEENGHKRKRPTESGMRMGIHVEHVVNDYQEYDAVFYDEKIQRYIINHFDFFLQFLSLA